MKGCTVVEEVVWWLPYHSAA